MAELLIGFDSAWADNPKAPGAICALRIDEAGDQIFVEPRLATFNEALDFVASLSTPDDMTLVAIDQPLIVRNATGGRPCERVAASVISAMKGGVQPANLEGSGRRFFGVESGIRRFLSVLNAELDPLAARLAQDGLFAIEVFPALALATIAPVTWKR